MAATSRENCSSLRPARRLTRSLQSLEADLGQNLQLKFALYQQHDPEAGLVAEHAGAGIAQRDAFAQTRFNTPGKTLI